MSLVFCHVKFAGIKKKRAFWIIAILLSRKPKANQNWYSLLIFAGVSNCSVSLRLLRGWKSGNKLTRRHVLKTFNCVIALLIMHQPTGRDPIVWFWWLSKLGCFFSLFFFNFFLNFAKLLGWFSFFHCAISSIYDVFSCNSIFYLKYFL